MASISSTNSTSSLGNTSLRGFGGMASGIDRDSIIEQMTLGTTTKINNQKKKMTQLQWKQEAYMNISDKIIDLTDKYASYSSSSNLKDPTAFAKNVISVHGKESSTSFVTATGTSDLINNVSILGVGQLATSTVQRSQTHVSDTGLSTTVSDLGEISYSSKLAGLKLDLGVYTDDGKGGHYSNEYTFEFKTSYDTTGTDGQTTKKDINYTPKTEKEYKQLVDDLNKLAEDDGKYIKFSLKSESNLALTYPSSDPNASSFPAGTKFYITVEAGDDIGNRVIKSSSSALTALGYKPAKDSSINAKDGISINEFQQGQTVKSFEESAIHQQSTIDYLTKKILYFNYDGNQKGVELVSDKEAQRINELTVQGNYTVEEITELENTLKSLGLTDLLDVSSNLLGGTKLTDLHKRLSLKLAELNEQLQSDSITDTEKSQIKDNIQAIEKQIGKKDESGNIVELGNIAKKQMAELAEINENGGGLQGRLNRAFGDNMVKVNFDGNISFTTAKKGSSLSALTSDYNLLRELGISYGESNKVNLGGKIDQGALKKVLKGLVDDKSGASNDITKTNGELNLKINGVNIGGLTKDSTISDILSKINSSNAGVKATYVDATGEFMLIASETGEGRNITFDTDLTKALFDGGKDKLEEGKNAEVYVSYGDGRAVKLDRASNTFDLEGLSVTVSGVFGGNYVYKKAETGASFGTKDKEGYALNPDTGERIVLDWVNDTSAAVTFSAKADVDAAVEKVKTFFEDFNALVTSINSEITTRPDSSYQPLTDEQKDQMDETSIENWEKKAKQGMLYGDSNMRDLSVAVQSIFTKMMSNGASYEDLKEIGITYSEDYGDGGTLVFDESAFRTAMENNPEKVSRIFTGGNGISKGLINVVEDTFTPYATRYANRNGGSYGRLVEVAGTNKKPTTLMNNDIYKQLKEMQETIDSLNARLKTEQDRYISQFTTMETLLNKMNTQSSYLSQLGI